MSQSITSHNSTKNNELERVNVAIVDMGMGNLFSVAQACKEAGLTAVLVTTPVEASKADGLILPGVGAFDVAVTRLKEMGFFDYIKDYNKPLFGICLGMQLLLDHCDEGEGSEGFGIISGDVKKFPNTESNSAQKLRVPHIGWDSIKYTSEDLKQGSLLRSLDENSLMYFVHSYYVICNNKEAVVTLSEYGGYEFCSSIQQGNVFGCQFHPEKSGQIGISIYSEFKSKILLNKG